MTPAERARLRELLGTPGPWSHVALRDALPALLDAAEECERLRGEMGAHLRSTDPFAPVALSGLRNQARRERNAAIARAEAAEAELAALRVVFVAADDAACLVEHATECAVSAWLDHYERATADDRKPDPRPDCDCAKRRLRVALDKARGT